MSLRWRLTLLYTAVFLCCGGLLLGAAYWLLRGSLAGQAPVPPKVLAVGPVPDTGPVRLTDGRVVAVDEYRRELVADQARSQAALDGYHGDILHALLVREFAALAVVTPAALGLGWVAAGRGLRPLTRMTVTVRHIARAPAAEGLNTRIGVTGTRDEVEQLASAFDAMLARLDAAFATQRRFVAHAAHELRTPLAVERAVLEVALGAPGADVGTVRDRLLDVNRRQTQMLNGLLALARAEQSEPRTEPVALDRVTGHELSIMDTIAVRLRSQLAPTPVDGDPALLALLVDNLVGNAVRHNVPDGEVEVRVAPDGGRAVLSVVNTGPVVDPRELPELFEPFRRGPAARSGATPGAGLGLAIVRAVVAAHHGEVTATARPDGGLVVRVELPLRPAVT